MTRTNELDFPSAEQEFALYLRNFAMAMMPAAAVGLIAILFL
jgi:hypothetical protein